MATVELLKKVLTESKTVALVGLSDKPYRPSYFVGKYLLDHGFNIVPVNPVCKEILGHKSYPTLSAIPFDVDLVDCFRRADEMPELARQAIAIGANTLWMQLSVVNEEAKQIATDAGLTVVMDRCTKIEHARLFGGLGWVGVNTRIISAKRPRHVNS